VAEEVAGATTERRIAWLTLLFGFTAAAILAFSHQRPEKMIDQPGYSEYVFFHSLFHGMQDFPHTGRNRRGC